MNLAKVLAEGKKIKILTTGIRPGEKVHEILISEEEIHHCEKRGDFYVIKSMLPELNEGIDAPAVSMKEYSSKNIVLDIDGTRELLRKHNLLFINKKEETYGEFLR